jgi:hypothetical protein
MDFVELGNRLAREAAVEVLAGALANCEDGSPVMEMKGCIEEKERSCTGFSGRLKASVDEFKAEYERYMQLAEESVLPAPMPDGA